MNFKFVTPLPFIIQFNVMLMPYRSRTRFDAGTGNARWMMLRCCCCCCYCCSVSISFSRNLNFISLFPSANLRRFKFVRVTHRPHSSHMLPLWWLMLRLYHIYSSVVIAVHLRDPREMKKIKSDGWK